MIKPLLCLATAGALADAAASSTGFLLGPGDLARGLRLEAGLPVLDREDAAWRGRRLGALAERAVDAAEEAKGVYVYDFREREEVRRLAAEARAAVARAVDLVDGRGGSGR